jgi:hypothetical protein
MGIIVLLRVIKLIMKKINSGNYHNWYYISFSSKVLYKKRPKETSFILVLVLSSIFLLFFSYTV